MFGGKGWVTESFSQGFAQKHENVCLPNQSHACSWHCLTLKTLNQKKKKKRCPFNEIIKIIDDTQMYLI